MRKIESLIMISVLSLSMFSIFTPRAVATGSPPVAYWKFDEGSGSIAADSSGNGNTGTLNGPQWVDGVSYKALKFDGTDDYVYVPDSPSLDIGGYQMSVEFWMNLGLDWYTGIDHNNSCVYDKGDAYTSSLIANSGALRYNLAYVPVRETPETVKNSWAANTWFFVAEVYNDPYIKIYVNGVLDHSEPVSGPIPHSGINLCIGAHSLRIDQIWFNGIIDEFAIYNYARTPEEILKDYSAYAGAGEIYIRADGSVDPSTAPISTEDNITYVFIGDVNDAVVVERDNIVIDGDGYTLQGSGSGIGMLVSNRFNVTIKNMVVQGFSDTDSIGIYLYHSPNCTVTDNFVSNNYYGIQSNSDYDIIANNTASSNSWGIILYATCNHVVGNNVSYNSEGIHVYISNHTVSSNTICGNTNGIHLEDCSSDIISNNRIFDNLRGIWLSGARGDRIFHNEFTNNNEQVHDESIPQNPNTWDDGYPSGGNFWSDYTGADDYSGPNQDQFGHDGIGDTSYLMDPSNEDHYPLMSPWISEQLSYDWPMLHHDSAHTGFSESEAPETGNVLWKFPEVPNYDNEYTRVCVANGRLYFGDIWDFYCLNASTGTVIWKKESIYPNTIGGAIGSCPAVGDGKVYIFGSVGYTDTLLCFDAETGGSLWNYSAPPSGCGTSPTLAYGRIYIGLVSSLCCLNASTGTLIWSYDTVNNGISSPAVFDGKVYVGSGDSTIGVVYCVDAFSGAPIWNYTRIGIALWSSPVVAYDRVYAASFNGPDLCCFNASTGALIWNKPIGDNIGCSSPAVAYGKVFIGGEWEHKIWCFDAYNGEPVWDFTTDGGVFYLAVAEGKVYADSYLGSIYCLNASTGAYVWSHYLIGNGPGAAGPVVANGIMYVSVIYGEGVLAFGDVRDVSLENVETSKTGCLPVETVGQNCTCQIVTTAENQGNLTETFNVTVYASNQTRSFVIGRIQATIKPGENANLTIVWNTTGFAKGNYTINMQADTVPGETEISDNSFFGETLLLGMLGDINGDGKVDVKDVYVTALAFGTKREGPNPEGRRYNPNCDINNDYKIDVKDYYIVCKHYGETDP